MDTNIRYVGLAITMAATLASSAYCAEKSETPVVPSNADQVLTGVDDAMNAFKDQKIFMKLTLVDAKGNTKMRTSESLQKGANMRVARFLTPADQKGIAFLSLPNDVMYIYMPAFQKTRRIASHVKNGKFAGTDFTYEDMEAKRYTEIWIPKITGSEAGICTMELTLKPGKKSEYSKMIMQVRMDCMNPVRIEMYGKNGKLMKIQVREKLEKIGEYWVARSMTMEDVKSKHKSVMDFDKVEFDLGLSDELFTERALAR